MNLLEDKKDKIDEFSTQEAWNENKINQKSLEETKKSTIEDKFYINMRRKFFFEEVNKIVNNWQEKKRCLKKEWKIHRIFESYH